jgi:hypothetical protein
MSYGIKNIDFSSFINAFSNLQRPVPTGRIDLAGRFVSTGYGIDNFIKNLSCESSFKAYNISIPSFDTNSIALSFLRPSKKDICLLSEDKFVNQVILSGQKNIYSTMNGKVVIKDGVLNILDSSLKSNISVSSINGNFDIKNNIYYFVGKTAINAINFKSYESQQLIPILLSFVNSNKNQQDIYDINLKQVLAYTQSYCEYVKQKNKKQKY